MGGQIQIRGGFWTADREMGPDSPGGLEVTARSSCGEDGGRVRTRDGVRGLGHHGQGYMVQTAPTASQSPLPREPHREPLQGALLQESHHDHGARGAPPSACGVGVAAHAPRSWLCPGTACSSPLDLHLALTEHSQGTQVAVGLPWSLHVRLSLAAVGRGARFWILRRAAQPTAPSRAATRGQGCLPRSAPDLFSQSIIHPQTRVLVPPTLQRRGPPRARTQGGATGAVWAAAPRASSSQHTLCPLVRRGPEGT